MRRRSRNDCKLHRGGKLRRWPSRVERRVGVIAADSRLQKWQPGARPIFGESFIPKWFQRYCLGL